MIRIEIKGLVIGYGSRPLRSVVDSAFSSDRLNVITGPNGIGKTTLLKTLAGLIPPVDGYVSPAPRAGRGGTTYVAPSPWLFAGTVARNMTLAGLERTAVSEALRTMGVEALSTDASHVLSTGQLQRVAIARAIALDPEVLLVDEPERGLDAEGVALWRAFVRQSVENRRPLIVMAAHDLRASEKDLPIEALNLGGDDLSL